jgi:hypothetical protein
VLSKPRQTQLFENWGQKTLPQNQMNPAKLLVVAFCSLIATFLIAGAAHLLLPLIGLHEGNWSQVECTLSAVLLVISFVLCSSNMEGDFKNLKIAGFFIALLAQVLAHTALLGSGQTTTIFSIGIPTYVILFLCGLMSGLATAI